MRASRWPTRRWERLLPRAPDHENPWLTSVVDIGGGTVLMTMMGGRMGDVGLKQEKTCGNNMTVAQNMPIVLLFLFPGLRSPA